MVIAFKISCDKVFFRVMVDIKYDLFEVHLIRNFYTIEVPGKQVPFSIQFPIDVHGITDKQFSQLVPNRCRFSH